MDIDLIEALQRAFEPMAIRCDDLNSNATRHNVEILYGEKENKGLLRIRFKAKNEMVIAFTIEVAEMLKDHEKYIHGVMEDIASAMREAKRKRAIEKPIILLS